MHAQPVFAKGGVDAIAASEFGLVEPDETGADFRENARIKAEAAARSSTTISIEIGGAVVRAAVGVDPAWLRDVLRAVRAAT